MPAIRNSCVARGTFSANTPADVYVVPANNNFILKSILIQNGSAAAVTPQIQLNIPGGATSVMVEVPTIASNTTNIWSGWTVLNGGDKITMYPNGFPVYYWIAGAVLPFA